MPPWSVSGGGRSQMGDYLDRTAPTDHVQDAPGSCPADQGPVAEQRHDRPQAAGGLPTCTRSARSRESPDIELALKKRVRMIPIRVHAQGAGLPFACRVAAIPSARRSKA